MMLPEKGGLRAETELNLACVNFHVIDYGITV